jgi:hypothetical protein
MKLVVQWLDPKELSVARALARCALSSRQRAHQVACLWCGASSLPTSCSERSGMVNGDNQAH